MQQKIAVGLYNISKRFPTVIALDNVTIEAYVGEVHAILGENGAGKTTLMNILFGLLKPDAGYIKLYDEKVDIRSPKEAMKLGIGMVHQHFSLIPTLTVYENFKIFSSKVRVDEKKIIELAERLNLKIDPNEKVSNLSVGERQRLEVLRLLYFDFKILIFDEPTSVLTPIETANLLEEIRTIAQEGRTIFFISHKLNEVKRVSDRISVLKKGKLVTTDINERMSTEYLIKCMIDKVPILQQKSKDSNSSNVILEISNLKVRSTKGHICVNLKPPFDKIKIHENEIVGLAGVAGSGQKELFDAIAGLTKVLEGKILFKGNDITSCSVLERIRLGIGYIPEDRIYTGVAPELSLYENFMLKTLNNDKSFKKSVFLDKKKLIEIAEKLVKEYDIKAANVFVPIKTLSGGNIQKVIVAREISMKPSLLLAYEPTKGLDVGATYYIRNKLIEYSKEHGIFVFSEDLEELMSISDRLYVIHNGTIVKEFTRENFDEYKIGAAMVGLERV